MLNIQVFLFQLTVVAMRLYPFYKYFSTELSSLCNYELYGKTGSAATGFTGIGIIESKTPRVQPTLPIYFHTH